MTSPSIDEKNRAEARLDLEIADWNKSAFGLDDGNKEPLYGSFVVGDWSVRVSFGQTGQTIEEFQSLEMFVDMLGEVPE